ncbi:hypothetical protein [uncultured Treponema sp.]|uniref:hypothetical protein n=1 Tax=uncultured Treponema sp. TaxID=162155 RepID=UPI0025FAF6B8|nr:hypothetical protein [uncultured Treponema sp.]
MTRHAILCGSAPDGFTQKKINEMHDFLTSEAGGFWAEKEIVIFPNGVSEAMLSFVLERLKADKTEQILLYICTLSPVSDEDKSVWLGGEEVRKSVIEDFGNCGGIETQVVYDCGREVVSDEEMEKEEKILESKITSLSFAKEEKKN